MDDLPKLLAGGKPQIPKGDGPELVRAYLDAVPGWKRDVAVRLDTLIEAAVPDVRKAVRWNSPFYGVEGQGWFASFHCFTRYVKVTFFAGSSLDPVPPEASKDPTARYAHLFEDAGPADDELAAWFAQAAALDGWHGFSEDR